jgi:hypothetical protein
MAKKPPSDPGDVRIGKFEILATYTYAKALLDGHADEDAKQRGMAEAIAGAAARRGGAADYLAVREAAEKKTKTSITAASFDHQIAEKLGPFFGAVFLPAMKALAEARLSYEDTKRALKIPRTWGAKITAKEFQERASDVIGKPKR